MVTSIFPSDKTIITLHSSKTNCFVDNISTASSAVAITPTAKDDCMKLINNELVVTANNNGGSTTTMSSLSIGGGGPQTAGGGAVSTVMKKTYSAVLTSGGGGGASGMCTGALNHFRVKKIQVDPF